MANSDNLNIGTLQENIPLSEAEKTEVEKIIKTTKSNFWFMFFCVMGTLVYCVFDLKSEFFAGIGLFITGFCVIFLLLCWHVVNKVIAINSMDVRKGKSVLTGKLISKTSHRSKYRKGYCFHFLVPPKHLSDKLGVKETNYPRFQIFKIVPKEINFPDSRLILIGVNMTDYIRYQEGEMLTVSLLPTIRSAINIVAQ